MLGTLFGIARVIYRHGDYRQISKIVKIIRYEVVMVSMDRMCTLTVNDLEDAYAEVTGLASAPRPRSSIS